MSANALGGAYLTNLRNAATSAEQATDAGSQSRAKRVGATAAVRAEASKGRKAVQVLDVLVQEQLAGNDNLLAEWNSR